MLVHQVQELLDRHEVKYQTITHSRAYTAQEAAAAAAVSGNEVAKTVMIEVGGEMAMAVLPASAQVDFNVLAGEIGVSQVVLAHEREFEDLFPGCETGAMPPFGNLYGMQVYVEELLTQDREILFHCGSLTEMVRMAYSDYERLVQPRVRVFAYCPWLIRHVA